MHLSVVTPTPSLRHDGGNQALNANKCERKPTCCSPHDVKWVRTGPTLLQPGKQQREPLACFFIFFYFLWGIGIQHMSHCGRVCAGVRRSGERGGSHTAGMSSYLDQPVFTSPSAAALFSSPSLKTRSQTPGTTPVPLRRTSVLGKKERMDLRVFARQDI